MNSELLKNIETGVFRLTKKKDSRSKIWKIFSQIEKDDGTTIDGVVKVPGDDQMFVKYLSNDSMNSMQRRR